MLLSAPAKHIFPLSTISQTNGSDLVLLSLLSFLSFDSVDSSLSFALNNLYDDTTAGCSSFLGKGFFVYPPPGLI